MKYYVGSNRSKHYVYDTDTDCIAKYGSIGFRKIFSSLDLPIKSDTFAVVDNAYVGISRRMSIEDVNRLVKRYPLLKFGINFGIGGFVHINKVGLLKKIDIEMPVHAYTEDVQKYLERYSDSLIAIIKGGILFIWYEGEMIQLGMSTIDTRITCLGMYGSKLVMGVCSNNKLDLIPVSEYEGCERKNMSKTAFKRYIMML